MCRFFLVLLTLLSWKSRSSAQNLPEEAQGGLLIGLSYGYGFSGGDMAKRYGNHFMAGLNPEYISGKGLWVIGLEGCGFFGKDVREDVLANIKNSDGDILGNNRALASFYTRERGLQGNLYLGKIIRIGKGAHTQGIKITAGAGYMQHKVKVLDEFSSLVQLSGDYVAGYDRLSSGLMLHESIGFQRLDALRRFSFFANLDFYQGFTRGRRSFNYSSMQPGTEKRLDLLTGFRVGFILPFYFGQNTKEIYY